MQERINLVGGRLTVDSAPGEGTEVRVTAPLGHAAQEERALQLQNTALQRTPSSLVSK
jgi:signal transduction histidine kinase